MSVSVTLTLKHKKTLFQHTPEGHGFHPHYGRFFKTYYSHVSEFFKFLFGTEMLGVNSSCNHPSSGP
jgi:hypothetical protein